MLETYKHRIGKFSLPRATVNQKTFDLLPIFARVVVVDCVQDYAMDTFVYLALSPDFAEVPMGTEAPEYRWEIETGAGTITFKPVRVEC